MNTSTARMDPALVRLGLVLVIGMIVILSHYLAATAGTVGMVGDSYNSTFWWATAIGAAGALMALLLPGNRKATAPAAVLGHPD